MIKSSKKQSQNQQSAEEHNPTNKGIEITYIHLNDMAITCCQQTNSKEMGLLYSISVPLREDLILGNPPLSFRNSEQDQMDSTRGRKQSVLSQAVEGFKGWVELSIRLENMC